MIVTLTPNPSIDRSISVPQLLHGEVNRASASRVDPGGKGINVSRALAAQGAATVAVLPSGGPEGALMGELLRAADVEHVTVPVRGSRTGGLRSDSRKDSATGPSASPATWPSTSRAVSSSISSKGARPRTPPRSSTSNSMNSMSRTW